MAVIEPKITRSAFIYLAESIRCFPPPEKVQGLLESAGFIRVTFQRLSNGLVTVYSATKLVSL
jgi:demethylmenaquinone methyltransferase/2-methoxy-6-polyprenyl-1,4-benzoquinol methylase